MAPKSNMSIRLTDEQRDRLEAIAEVETERTGWPVTPSAALRKALDAGLAVIEAEVGIGRKRPASGRAGTKKRARRAGGK